MLKREWGKQVDGSRKGVRTIDMVNRGCRFGSTRNERWESIPSDLDQRRRHDDRRDPANPARGGPDWGRGTTALAFTTRRCLGRDERTWRQNVLADGLH